jgi:hypothetical protein
MAHRSPGDTPLLSHGGISATGNTGTGGVSAGGAGGTDVAVDAERQLDESERGCQEKLEELTILQTRDSELCFAIVGPPFVRNHLLEWMQIAALHHNMMAGELAALRTAVYSTVEFTLGRSPNETFWVEVVDELVAEFWKLEEWCSWPEWLIRTRVA